MRLVPLLGKKVNVVQTCVESEEVYYPALVWQYANVGYSIVRTEGGPQLYKGGKLIPFDPREVPGEILQLYNGLSSVCDSGCFRIVTV